eukprot:gene14601-10440_t
MLSNVIREEWKSPFPVVYFDNAGRSHQPLSVEKVGLESLSLKTNPWEGLPGSDDEDVQELRYLYSSLINGGSDGSNIALFPSTAFAMSMIAENVVRLNLIKRGESIIILDKEMGSVVYPWQHVCERLGCVMKVIPTPDWTVAGASWTSSIINAIDDSVAILSLPNVHWCDGTLIDLEVISDELKRFGEDGRQNKLLIVDGTQSIGAIPFDVQKIKADAVACSVHKWLLSPYGTSLVYVNPRHHNTWLPLDQHERARAGSQFSVWDEEIFMDARGYFPSEFFGGARRLDAGGRANPIFVPMLRSALKLIHSITVPAIYEHLTSFCDALQLKLSQLPAYHDIFAIAPKEQRGGHILGLRFHDLELLRKVHKTLKEHGIHTSVRGHCLRISPYLSNTIQDANLFQALFFQSIQLHRRDATDHDSNNTCCTKPLRVLITGACGWLAQFMTRSLLTNPGDRPLEVFGAYRPSSPTTKVPVWLLQAYRVEMDLSSPASVDAVITSIQPDIILHFAALSSPVACHKDPAFARLVNAPSHLVDAVQRHVPNALFVFASTDMVYDGESPPYTVSAADGKSLLHPTQAVNVYGATKRAMEELVSQLRYGISLRLSNMIGAPFVYQAGGEKFLQFLSSQLQRRSVIGLKRDEVRSFVYVEDVVRVVSLLIERYVRLTPEATEGLLRETVLNMGGPQPLSRLELAELFSRTQHVPLSVADDEEAAQQMKASSSTDTWVVHVLPSASPIDTRGLDWSTMVTLPLRSPRNIAMDSSATEAALGFTFTKLEDILPLSLVPR